jgi:putative transposase
MIEKANSGVSIRHQCRLLNLPRSGIYTERRATNDRDKKLLDLIDEIFLEFPEYGSRRMMKSLRRKGYPVGRTRVRSLMKKGGIESIYPRKKLSIPGKGHKIYPYLLKGVKIDRPNKVWAADITYIRMQKGFLYLVAIIDLYSRFILSWRLSNTLEGEFCREALKEALKNYKSPDYFNTDQGSQFTSDDFTKILKEKGIKISMDGKGRWIDNIFIERFWRTLKYSEVYIKSYLDVKDCRNNLEEFFDKYNNDRLHQSLAYRTPMEVYSGMRMVV